MFDYYHKDTTRKDRLEYLEGWTSARCGVGAQFPHGVDAPSEAFEAGKADARA